MKLAVSNKLNLLIMISTLATSYFRHSPHVLLTLTAYVPPFDLHPLTCLNLPFTAPAISLNVVCSTTLKRCSGVLGCRHLAAASVIRS